MAARASTGNGGGAVAGSSHTITPEKSFFLLTVESFESRRATLPLTDAAARGIPAASRNTTNDVAAVDMSDVDRTDVARALACSSGIRAAGSEYAGTNAGAAR